jgi:ribonuclease III
MKSTGPNTSQLEEALGHVFRRPDLLKQALTHASYAREAESHLASPIRGPLVRAAAENGIRCHPDNEQMEFLGDAVLSFVISQELFRRFPEYREGELSKLRAHIVSARRLLRPAHELKIGEYLLLGRGEERSGGRNKSALLVDTLEALIAALFLDAGLEVAQRFIRQNILEPELAEMHVMRGSKELPVMDYKSALQEAVHASGRSQARYVIVKEEGPDHRKTFTVEAHIPSSPAADDGFVCRSEGSTKKSAEQAAARLAWEHLQLLESRSAVENHAAGATQSDRS